MRAGGWLQAPPCSRQGHPGPPQLGRRSPELDGPRVSCRVSSVSCTFSSLPWLRPLRSHSASGKPALLALCSVPCRSRAEVVSAAPSVTLPPGTVPWGLLLRHRAGGRVPGMGCLAPPPPPPAPPAGGGAGGGGGGLRTERPCHVTRSEGSSRRGSQCGKGQAGPGGAAQKAGSCRGSSAGPSVRTGPCRAGFPRAHDTVWRAPLVCGI